MQCACQLVLTLMLILAQPVMAQERHRQTYPVGNSFEYGWRPSSQELAPGNVVHSMVNLKLMQKAFEQTNQHPQHLAAIKSYLGDTQGGGLSSRTMPRGTKYRRNYWVHYLGPCKRSGHGLFRVYYDLDQGQQWYTDRFDRELDLIPDTEFGVSKERCWNLIWLYPSSKPVSKPPESVLVQPLSPPEPPLIVPARLVITTDAEYDQALPEPVATTSTPLPPPPSLVQRKRRETPPINFLPGGNSYFTVAPSSQATESIGSIGFFGRSSSGHKSGCSCFRCQLKPQPRPTPRPGGPNPPLGAQPRTDPGNGSPPSGQPRPEY